MALPQTFDQLVRTIRNTCYGRVIVTPVSTPDAYENYFSSRQRGTWDTMMWGLYAETNGLTQGDPTEPGRQFDRTDFNLMQHPTHYNRVTPAFTNGTRR